MEQYDAQIKSLVKESDFAKQQYDSNQQASRVAGRVSYFLDSFEGSTHFETIKLERYQEEIKELELQFSTDAKEERFEIAQASISEYATEIFSKLPRGEPCGTGKILFRAKRPDVLIYDTSSRRKVRFKEIGSDENYLSIHIAVIFGLQRFLEKGSRPVPGVVIIDQVSRPYYPQEKYPDEIELGADDEDTIALKKHFDFLFNEAEERSGLQIIVLEHAYFRDDLRFRNATQYRWSRESQEKLIPQDWPNLD